MGLVTKTAKVALTAIALKKLAQLTKHGGHATGSHALEHAIHATHASAFGDDSRDDEDDESASDDDDDDKFANVMIDPKKAVAKANARIDAAAADVPDHKRGGKASPLAGTSSMKRWAQTPGGRNAPPQRRG